jgi:hypothetical protein
MSECWLSREYEDVLHELVEEGVLGLEVCAAAD